MSPEESNALQCIMDISVAIGYLQRTVDENDANDFTVAGIINGLANAREYIRKDLEESNGSK